MAQDLSRRTALKVMFSAGAATAATALSAANAEASAKTFPMPSDPIGMLYDTTLCIGCKACVTACREANNLEPTRDSWNGGIHQAPVDLDSNTKNIIKLYKEGDYQSYFKGQCMQCLEPACAAACMMHALVKDPVTGVVRWHGSTCVGCRYCQIGCPYNVPKFEWTSYNPKIVKCELCEHRGDPKKTGIYQQANPACCEVCPRGAVIFGRREDLLREARTRIQQNPGRYHENRIFGEHEGGGTQVLYLSHVPFDKVGLPALSQDSIPAYVHSVQGKIYYGFIAPVVAYGILGTIITRNRRKAEVEEAEAQKETRS